MKNTCDAIPAPLVDQVAQSNKARGGYPPVALGSDFFDIPATTTNNDICHRAERHVLSTLPLWLANHCFRTYAFALAIARHAGWDQGETARSLGFDRELLFLACALHELGFTTEKSTEEDRASPMSLELLGGIKAREWILQQQQRKEDDDDDEPNKSDENKNKQLAYWADEACESITRHTTEFRGFSGRCRVTLALVVLGSGHDLMGLSREFVHADDQTAILRRWPRAGYCEGLRRAAGDEVRRKPACMFEDCVPAFDPGMFEVEIFRGLQGELEE